MRYFPDHRFAAHASALMLLASCTGQPDDTGRTDDTDAQPSRVPLAGVWSSTSLPTMSQNGTGWWDFPWGDAASWCETIEVTDGRFVDEDGAVADCWDGPPSRCFEWGEFVGNGEVNTIYEVEAKPCGQRREVEYVAVLEERTSWEFLGRAGDRDEFLVDQRVWMFDATPNAQTGTYTVTVDGTTYEMNRQFDEW